MYLHALLALAASALGQPRRAQRLLGLERPVSSFKPALSTIHQGRLGRGSARRIINDEVRPLSLIPPRTPRALQWMDREATRLYQQGE